MANAVVTMKIMPENPEVNLDSVKSEALKVIEGFAGKGDTKAVEEPIAFGLKALKITFIMDEQLGSPDNIESKITSIEGVNSFEIVDVRRAVG